MNDSNADRILADWVAVANEARRPDAPPRRAVVRSGLPAATMAGASVVLVGLALGGLLLGRGDLNGVGAGTSPTPQPSPAVPSASPVAEATPSAAPTPSTCGPNTLLAAITMWEGAAGHRIAHVEVTNDGSTGCLMQARSRPQLVDGRGTVLIDGVAPNAPGLISLDPGGTLATLVQAGNYCGPAPERWVSVAFVHSDGGLIVASPASPSDMTLPPCLGEGESATVEMQPWAPR